MPRPRSRHRAMPRNSASEAATQTAEDTAERSDDWQAEIGAPASRGEDDEEGDRAFAAADTPTLRDHLNQQLTLTGIGERDRALVGAADRRARRGRLPHAAAGGDRGAVLRRGAGGPRGAGDRAQAPAEPRARRRGRALAGRVPAAAVGRTAAISRPAPSPRRSPASTWSCLPGATTRGCARSPARRRKTCARRRNSSRA